MSNRKKIIFLCIIALIVSCGTKRIPNGVVPLNENQLSRLNGYYEIEPYSSSENQYSKPLDEIFEFNIPSQITYFKLEILTKNKLIISYDLDGIVQQKVIKGKAKHGGFYLHKRWGGIGIPLLFWLQWNEGKRIFMGNDDNLIFDNFEDGNLMLFGFQTSKAERETYYYDRLYPTIYTGQPQKN